MNTDYDNVVVERLLEGLRIEKPSYFYVLESGPLMVFWDEGSTWYIKFDHSAAGREQLEFGGMCGNFDGDPHSKYTVYPVYGLLDTDAL